MNNVKKVPPIACVICHGEKKMVDGKEKLFEYDYFLSKCNKDSMKFISQKFDARYKGSKSIPIYVCGENPISRRYVRYNQSGVACKRSFDQEKARDRKNNLIECNEDTCQYRQSVNGKTPACREELMFTFMMPDICQDRAFLLQTKSSNSLTALGNYFGFQKHLGNSVVGKYNLFLQPTETVSPDGIRSTHYIYGIVKVEDQELVVAENPVTAEEKFDIIISEKTPTVEVLEEKVEKPVENEPIVKKKATKSKITEMLKESVVPETQETTKPEKPTDKEMERYHILLETKTIQLEKGGEKVNYLLGKFSNMKDEEVEAVIHTDYVEEFKQCELGTQVLLDLEKRKERLFVMKCEFLEKQLKIAA